MITLEGLRVVLGRTVALDSLTLPLEPGIVGLFGPNGSGKSTLLRALAGLLVPTGGRISLDGGALDASDEGFRARVGYVGHASGLYGPLSVAENLRLFAGLHGVGAGRVGEVLEHLGLTEVAGTPARALSAGLKRRAAVARALVHAPDLLLLDEPYANLDDEAAACVTGAVLAWRAPTRLGVIATHGAKRVKGFVDASLVLQRGRAVSYRMRRPAVRER